MLHRSRTIVSALALTLAACGGDTSEESSPEAIGPGAETPVAAVEAMIDAINTADFAAAGQMSVPGQAALASLAEGATFGDVADALEDGDGQVAVNLWSGFAQGAGSLLTGDVSVAEDSVITQDEVDFHQVVVTTAGGESRMVLARNVDGFRVDLFASFGKAWADKMISPVERLLT
ncbi:MAG TPA: hypothetical protein VK969_08810, partial [Acidimicrobiia bacterium]|nr:hypothetical protein [Acidimicrobiia bacterium]